MRPVQPDDRRIWLGSRSPRRKALLEQLGFEPQIRLADVVEIPEPDERPEDYTTRLATSKGRAVRDTLTGVDGPSWIVAADTIVVLADAKGLLHILEKPVDVQDAIAILTALSGQQHEVLTGFWIGNTLGDIEQGGLVRSQVTFRTLSDETIARYVATEEPMDKAGAYGIQGIGAALIASIHGSYFNIVGLPIAEVAAVMHELGALEGFPFPPKHGEAWP